MKDMMGLDLVGGGGTIKDIMALVLRGRRYRKHDGFVLRGEWLFKRLSL